jgi:hypothetical protein
VVGESDIKQETGLEPGQELVVEVVDDRLTEVVRDRPGDGGAGDVELGRPHALFWVSLALLVPAVWAAQAAAGDAPGVALRSDWVWRIEIGLLVVVLGHLLTVVLWLAYFGKTVARVELPSGAGVEVPGGGDLKRAAEETDSITTQVRQNQQRQNEINRLLLRRLNAAAPEDDDDERQVAR